MIRDRIVTGPGMDTYGIDRRCARPVCEGDWKRMINVDQALTLRTVELVGWTLRFVRRNDNGDPLAIVYDPDHKTLSAIEPDGTLRENPGLVFRR